MWLTTEVGHRLNEPRPTEVAGQHKFDRCSDQGGLAEASNPQSQGSTEYLEAAVE